MRGCTNTGSPNVVGGLKPRIEFGYTYTIRDHKKGRFFKFREVTLNTAYKMWYLQRYIDL